MSKKNPARFSLPKDSVLLTRSELNRLRVVASLDEDPAVISNATRERSLQTTRDQAALKKTKMIEHEQQRLNSIKPTDMELLRELERTNANQRVDEQKDEETEEAKQMNSLVNYARAVAIRDRQREELKEKKIQAKQDEVRWAALMEKERARDLEAREALESEKARIRRENAREVIGQIEERKAVKKEEEKKRQEEEEERVLAMKKQLEDAEKEKERKALLAKKQMLEIGEINKSFLERKKKEKERELEEDMKIVEFNKEQDRIATEKEAAKVRAEKERTLEIARFKLEKWEDKAAERDAIMQKRAEEQKEREWRQQEKARALKQAQIDAELREVRDLQVMSKKVLVKEAEEREREEFERKLEKQKEEIRKEQEVERKRQAAASENLKGVRSQIIDHVEKRKKECDIKLQEGATQREIEEARRERLLKLKQKKIAELRADNVPDKYIVDLEKLKI